MLVPVEQLKVIVFLNDRDVSQTPFLEINGIFKLLRNRLKVVRQIAQTFEI